MTLFISAQLKTWLRYAADDDFDAAAAELAETVAAGWLSDATDLTRADLEAAAVGPSPQVFSWALELGGIAYENPTSLQADSAGPVGTTWLDRRSQILAAASAWAQQHAPATTGGGFLPRGCFPPSQPWPDPPRVRWSGR